MHTDVTCSRKGYYCKKIKNVGAAGFELMTSTPADFVWAPVSVGSNHMLQKALVLI